MGDWKRLEVLLMPSDTDLVAESAAVATESEIEEDADSLETVSRCDLVSVFDAVIVDDFVLVAVLVGGWLRVSVFVPVSEGENFVAEAERDADASSSLIDVVEEGVGVEEIAEVTDFVDVADIVEESSVDGEIVKAVRPAVREEDAE